MPARKLYADASQYERKLERVIERLGAESYNYGHDRYGSWVEFRYRGELYRFDHSVEQARSHGMDISYGSDTFAQLVLAIEDLARIAERGIYDLQIWVSGLRYLPPPTEIPACFKILGFTTMPGDASEIDSRYRSLAKKYHPDAGGDGADFDVIRKAAEQAKKHMEAIA